MKTTRREFFRAALPAASLTPDGVAPKGTIDWHNHWFSPQSVAILKARTTGPHLGTDTDGRLVFVSGGSASTGKVPARPLPLAAEFTDVDARLAHLDRAGVQRQVISWPTTLGVDAALTAAEAKPLWTAFNEDLAALVRKHPDRFSGLAALPTSDIDWAARELDRSHRDLGLIGAVLPVGAFQTLEGAKRLTPIFEVAQKHGSHLYLHTGPAHPTIPGQTALDTPPDDAPALRAALERSASFALGALTLTQTGFLDPYPDVTVQIAMLGGSSAFYATWAKLHGGKGPDQAALLRRVYFDTGVYGRDPHTIDFATRVVGADRLLFGSDFPLATTDKTTAVLQRSALATSDQHRIFVANGQALFAAKKTPRV